MEKLLCVEGGEEKMEQRVEKLLCAERSEEKNGLGGGSQCLFIARALLGNIFWHGPRPTRAR